MSTIIIGYKKVSNPHISDQMYTNPVITCNENQKERLCIQDEKNYPFLQLKYVDMNKMMCVHQKNC